MVHRKVDDSGVCSVISKYNVWELLAFPNNVTLTESGTTCDRADDILIIDICLDLYFIEIYSGSVHSG